MDHSKHTELVPMLQQRLRSSGPEGTPLGGRYGILLSFTGTVERDIVPHLLQLAERSLATSGCSRKEMKRVLFVTIEAVQNVIHHGYIDPSGDIALYLTLENTPIGFQVHCGNWMATSDAAALSERVSHLNSLNHAQLRKLYIDVLCNGEQSGNQGNAGLGLISMAKRTRGPIEFVAEPPHDGVQHVTLTATIES